MFRLIKLAIYAFIGYALYELYQGMTTQPGRGGSFGRGSLGGGEFARGGSAGAQGESRDSAHNLTGAGAGRTEQTLDSDGGSIRHSVGRGVTAP